VAQRPPSPRTSRLADQIQRDLAELIRLEVKDPRVGLVTLTGVDLSSDHTHAKIHFTVMGDQVRVAEATTGLQRASGFLRSALAHGLKTRTVPELHFHYDESVAHGSRLSQLIDDAVRSDPGHES
jgi:ribosome-binding factor A